MKQSEAKSCIFAREIKKIFMAQKTKQKSITSESFRDNIIAALQDKKAQDIIELDLSSFGMSLFDRFIICTATSNVHADALSENVLMNVKHNLNILPKHIEGRNNAEWVLIDYFDTLVHIFLKESREFYNIESLWMDAQRIEHNLIEA